MPRHHATLILCCLTALLPAGRAATETVIEPRDPVTAARNLAHNDRRADALEMLEKRLKQQPDDSDARVLHGIILSWEGRYDEARTDLEAVLEGHRDHGDALPALINVELWSGHPERAETLARSALRRRPNEPTLMLAQARALKALGREREALATLNRLLEFDPGNRQAVGMRESMGEALHPLEVSFNHTSEWFNDGRTPWREEQVAIKGRTPAGALISRFSRADGYGLHSQQAEVDFYPRIRSGTYAYVNLGYSPDATLYPRYRFGTDLYQSLGRGFEGSGGYRRLGFRNPVHIYTASLSKYYGSWLFTSRVYLTPDSAGTSRSMQFSVRRYLGNDVSYWGFRYGFGSTPAETRTLADAMLLNSSGYAAELNYRLHGRLSFQGRVGMSREDRFLRNALRHYLVEAGLYFRL